MATGAFSFFSAFEACDATDILPFSFQAAKENGAFEYYQDTLWITLQIVSTGIVAPIIITMLSVVISALPMQPKPFQVVWVGGCVGRPFY